jgi:hypothetical protein
MAPKDSTGAGAVQQSKQARELQNEARVDRDAPSAAVRTVKGKTFYLLNGVWTDSEFKPEAKLPETNVQFGSDAYFALLKRKPVLSEYFALGEQVVFVFEGQVYRITAAAP